MLTGLCHLSPFRDDWWANGNCCGHLINKRKAARRRDGLAFVDAAVLVRLSYTFWPMVPKWITRRGEDSFSSAVGSFVSVSVHPSPGFTYWLWLWVDSLVKTRISHCHLVNYWPVTFLLPQNDSEEKVEERRYYAIIRSFLCVASHFIDCS